MWMAIERNVAALDRTLIVAMSHLRRPALNAVMVNFTAMGSPTVVGVLTVITLALLVTLRDRAGVLHLLGAAFGTWALTTLTKGLIERIRPTEVEHLIEVSGFSFPSGHSLAAGALYLTMALVAGNHLSTRASRAVLLAGALFIIVMVAASRVYLGVHYPSDVVSGVSLGAAWAMFLAWLVGALRVKKVLASAGC
jgi:undecaprenyl-diphosphatase